jgi:hypothetical protein
MVSSHMSSYMVDYMVFLCIKPPLFMPRPSAPQHRGASRDISVRNRMRWLLGHALFCISLLPIPTQAAGWQADLGTLSGKLTLLQALPARHPGVIIGGLQSRTNPIQLLDGAAEYMAHLGDDAASMEIGAGVRWAGASSSYTNFRYDEAAVERLRELIRADLKAFGQQPLAGDFSAALRTLSASRFKRFLRLAPLFYGDDRGLISDRQDIGAITAAELDSLYRDRYPGHLRETVVAFLKERGDAELQRLFNSHESQFIQRDVQSTLTMRATVPNQGKIHKASIEEVPPLIALFRSPFGGDCSMATVPYYPLIRGVKVYWIRKNDVFSTQPDGYALVVPVIYEGRTLPYVVTINGPRLGTANVRIALDLIAKDWNVRDIIVTDVERNPLVMNTEAVKKGFAFEGSESVEVALPPAWDRVTQMLNARGAGSYYDGQKLKSARLVHLDAASLAQYRGAVQSYPQISDLGTMALLDRALLAALSSLGHREGTFNQETHDRNVRDILQALQVSVRQHEVAGNIVKASDNRPLDLNHFQEAKAELGFTERDLTSLDVLTRAHTLGALGIGNGLNDEVLRDRTRRTDQELARDIEFVEDARARQLVLRARLALPVLDQETSIWNQLIAQLNSAEQSESWEEWLKALQGLTRVPESFSHQVVALMSHADLKVRLGIMGMIVTIKNHPPEMLRALVERLQDTDIQVRSAAVMVLRELRGPWPDFLWDALPGFIDANHDVSERGDQYTLVYNLIRALESQEQWPDAVMSKILAVLTPQEIPTTGHVLTDFLINKFEQPTAVQVAALYALGKLRQWPETVWTIIGNLLNIPMYQRDPNRGLMHALEGRGAWPVSIWNQVKSIIQTSKDNHYEQPRYWLNLLAAQFLVPPQEIHGEWLQLLDELESDKDRAGYLGPLVQRYRDVLVPVVEANASACGKLLTSGSPKK